MRVLIVNTSERTGGAAVAANRLMEALIKNGVKAKMLVRDKQTDNPCVIAHPQQRRLRWAFLWERLAIWLRLGLRRKHLFDIDTGQCGADITQLPEFQEADVIHLHWVNQGMLSLKQIKKILDSGKRIVWTMHDMWEMTGICHHAYRCDKYYQKCNCCPLLTFSGSRDFSSKVFKRKEKLFEHSEIKFVAVSNWLAGCARKSALIGNRKICVIPNSISLSHFPMTGCKEARSLLHLKNNYIITFGAARIDDGIKGFTYLLEALTLLIGRKQINRDEIHLLLFGGIKDKRILSNIPVPYTYYGYVSDLNMISLFYSASNVVVSSSYYETFGQTLIEAQACGSTPVAFSGSGQEDIITHKVNGYLAEQLSAESLADGIYWALNTGLERSMLRKNVEVHYSESIIARKYMEVYNEVISTEA